jgi:hypothetical protein
MSEAIPPLPQYAFMAWYLVTHRDNFTLYFYLFNFTVNIGCLWAVLGEEEQEADVGQQVDR